MGRAPLLTDGRLAAAALLIVLLAEHGYHWITWGPWGAQTTARYEYYCLRCPEIAALCALGMRHADSLTGGVRQLWVFTLGLAFSEAILTEIGGLVRFGEDVSVRSWGGRFIEVCGSFPVVVVLSMVLAGILTGAFNRKRR